MIMIMEFIELQRGSGGGGGVSDVAQTPTFFQ